MAFDITKILAYTFFGNSVEEYIIALAVFILTIVALKFFKRVIIEKLKKLAGRIKGEFDDLLINIVDSIGWSFYVLLALWTAFQFIRLPEKLGNYFSYFVLIVGVYCVVNALREVINFGASTLIQKRQTKGKKVDVSSINLLSGILQGILWLIAILFILQNMGFDITILVTGLGIGGLAIAFALQNILGDIFASFSIYFDKPFEVGDFIILGGDLGVVKKIGIKSTRIECLWGQEIVISNKELTETRINNYKKMEKRRLHFGFGVVYETQTAKLRKILDIVTDIFKDIELADLDRVHFKEFGDFSLNFEVAYYVGTGDYNKYMDTQQTINFALKEQFEKEGIEFAYPTQTVFVNKAPGGI